MVRLTSIFILLAALPSLVMADPQFAPSANSSPTGATSAAPTVAANPAASQGPSTNNNPAAAKGGTGATYGTQFAPRGPAPIATPGKPAAKPTQIMSGSGGPQGAYVEPEVKNCGQACAFRSAAEAQSLLGYYVQTVMLDDQKTRPKLKAAVGKCLSNGSCSKEDQLALIEAVSKYNLGKSIYAAILTNQTNHAEMTSLGKNFRPKLKGDEYWLQANRGSWKNTKTLQPSDNNMPYHHKFEVDNPGFGRLDENRLLGSAFLNEYKQFLNPEDDITKSLTRPNQSNYISVTGKDSRGFEISRDKKIDEQKLQRDIQLQSSPVVKKALADFSKDVKANIKQGEGINVDPSKIIDIGVVNFYGKTTEDNINANRKIAENINKDADNSRKANIEKGLKEAQAQGKLESNESKEKSVDLHIDLNAFNNYLEEIWPKGAATAQPKFAGSKR